MHYWRFLRWTALLQGVGAVLLILLDGSKLFKYVFLNTSASEQLSLLVNYATATLLALVTLLLWWRPKKSLLILMSLFFMTEALLTAEMGGGFAAWIAPFAHSLRFGWPWVLLGLLLSASTHSASHERLAMRFAGFLTAMTFIAHGTEALLGHPKFIDYLIVASQRLTPWRLPEQGASALLLAIGAVDILVALWAILMPHRFVFYYMAIWGLITAAARIIFAGWNGVPDFLLRAPHFMVPYLVGRCLQGQGFEVEVAHDDEYNARNQRSKPAKLKTSRRVAAWLANLRLNGQRWF